MKNLLIGLLIMGSISAFAGNQTGDLTCKGKVKNVEITIKYSFLLVASEIDLQLIKEDGRKIPFRGQKPRLVKMIDAIGEWGSDEEYYVSADDYVDLTIQSDDHGGFVAMYKHNLLSENLLEVKCK